MLKSLRYQLRQQRRALNRQEQHKAAQNLLKLISQQSWFLNAKNLAVYLANDGEIDPLPVALLAQKMGKNVYLPVLHPLNKGQLAFFRWQEDTQLSCNRFGILEPASSLYAWRYPDYCLVQALDVILMPLVGFDQQGNRLGMGGGFYDRTLEPPLAAFKRPKLIGLAHECQQVLSLPVRSWDLPMHQVVTPQQIIIPPLATTATACSVTTTEQEGV